MVNWIAKQILGLELLLQPLLSSPVGGSIYLVAEKEEK